MPRRSSQPPQAPSAEPTAAKRPVRSTKEARERSAATVRRHKEERRAESLRHIRAQTADGSLVIRQMTAAQFEEARVARDASVGRKSRPPRGTPPDTAA